MTDWQPRLLQEAELKDTEALLAASPDALEPRFHRAGLFAQLGRTEEAKAAYLDVLSRAPTHFGALNDFGNLLFGHGCRQAARSLYVEAVKHHPQNPRGHVNLANLLVGSGEHESARTHFEIALRLAPDLMEANRGLAYLATEMRDEAQAAQYREKAFRQQPVITLPYHGAGVPIELLVLASAAGGVIPMQHHFEGSLFRVSVLFADYYTPATPLPPHQRVVNIIGDADLCRPALEAAAKIVAKTNAPVINLPQNVLRTGRTENAQSLGQIADVVTPKMAKLPRERLEGPEAVGLLAEMGFTFPLLLRAPGFHTGHFFTRVECAQDLADAVALMPGQEILAIQYINARSRDGKIRKYRVMMIGGRLYPLHAAISHDWKIHYFTAEMADHPAHRAEDEAFLEDMAGVLGPRAIQALEKISRTLGLDYGGIDFSVNEEGEVVLFEANASMVVNPPDKDARWDYRRPAVQRILDAIRHLLTKPIPPQRPISSRFGPACYASRQRPLSVSSQPLLRASSVPAKG